MVSYASMPLAAAQRGPELLGTLVMIELRDNIAAPRDELRAIWADCGLDPGAAPRPRGPRDAFRVALPDRPVQGMTFIPYAGRKLPDHLDQAAILVHSAEAKSRFSLNHRNRGAVGLTRGGEVAVLATGQTTESDTALMEQVRDRFLELREVVDGQLIRGAVTRTLRRASAVHLRDGVQVAPAGAEETVEALVRLARRLDRYAPAPNIAFTATYVNSTDQAEQLTWLVERQVRKVLDARLIEVRAGKLGQRRSRTLLGELADIGILLQRYRAVLGDALGDISRYASLQQALIEAELTL